MYVHIFAQYLEHKSVYTIVATNKTYFGTTFLKTIKIIN